MSINENSLSENGVNQNGQQKKTKKLSKQDLFLLNVLSFNTTRDVIKEMGIFPDEFVSWLNDEDFIEKLEGYTTKIAKLILLDKIKGGNTEMIKLVLNKKYMRDDNNTEGSGEDDNKYKSILKLGETEYEI